MSIFGNKDEKANQSEERFNFIRAKQILESEISTQDK